MPENILLLTLQTFSTTGGIQKMTRTLGYSLSQLARVKVCKFNLWSLYDSQASLLDQYVPEHSFKGFGNFRLRYAWQLLTASRQTSHLILTHINLALFGVMVKAVNPKCKIYLIAHGIEVWRPLSYIQTLLLKKCHKILCVSTYTRQQLVKLHQTALTQTVVLNNALDPFTKLPADFARPAGLTERYAVKADEQIIFTLTRLSSAEQYKGYEKVIEAVARIKDSFPHIRYILAGRYDAVEASRIHELINKFKVNRQVTVTGFIDDSELTDHFLLADLFILPSKGEGFGLVYIEALACGLPVISGNADGSADAIRHGELGQSVDADSIEAIEQAIKQHLSRPLTAERRKLLQNTCNNYFNEQQYREKLWNILTDERTAA